MSSHISESRPKGKMRRSPQSPILSWQTVVLLGITIWLSCSLILDVVIMPSLYAAGMMNQSGFASAGYSIFWIFNRIELVFAALVLTGVLALYSLLRPVDRLGRWAIGVAIFLVAIPLIYTYALTPTMSALGLELTPFALTHQFPAAMNQLHRDYFGLEAIKLGLGCVLFGLCYRLTAEAV